ncbi:MAG: diguanylate cyclase [Gammaproteobacteria bacterium]
MRFDKDWRQVFSKVLDWSPAAKGMLVVAVLVPIFLQYLVWARYVLGRADRDQLINVDFYQGQQPVFALMAVTTVVTFLLGAHLRRFRPDSRAYEMFVVFFFTASLLYFGWLVGPLAMAAGIVLIGTPLVGFLLLDRRIVAFFWALSLATMAMLTVAAAAGHLTYGPLVVPRAFNDPQYGAFWVFTHLYWALPHVILNFAVAWFLLARWREREEAFRTQSMTDMLTGVHNRRSALLLLEREVARMRRRGPPLTVLLVDLDHFKRINDTWGHPTGDRALQAAASALESSVREYDAVGRWGGEEFILVLPETSPEVAEMLAERCRSRLEAMAVFADNGERVPVTGSFGLVCNANAMDADPQTLVRLADEALYRAKKAGRNRVAVASPVAASAPVVGTVVETRTGSSIEVTA